MILQEAQNKLSKYNQDHVLKYYDTLSEQDKDILLNQINETDFSVTDKVINKKDDGKCGVISPIKAMTLNEIEKNKDEYINTGIEAIREGKVGAVPVYIFQRIIRNLLDVVDEAGVWIHLFIMTSDKNHEATTSFFKEQNFFTYNPEYIHFFKQDMALLQHSREKYIWNHHQRLLHHLTATVDGFHQ